MTSACELRAALSSVTVASSSLTAASRCTSRRPASPSAAFGRLLECHDVDMLDWFTGHGQPEDPELREFVAGMLRRVAETD